MFPALLLALLLVSAIFTSSLPRIASAQNDATGEALAGNQLSDSTKQQIGALLAEKESRTPAQQKIDSLVLQAIRENRGQAMADSVTSLEPANIGQKDGSVVLDLRGIVDDNLLDALTQRGAEIINAFPVYQSVRIRVVLDRVEEIAALPQIRTISRELKPELEQAAASGRRAAVAPPVASSPDFNQRAANVRQLLGGLSSNKGGQVDSPQAGTVVSEGDRTHRADEARAAFGHQGEGIKVGVISDSYNALGAAPADVASGNLPGTGNPNGNTIPVTVIQDAGTTDEGRAMMQIVHDLVPKAQLYFATANGGPANFANNIIQLRNAGCNIIIDDISYSNESPFQSGVIGQAVETVIADGALYFASAGNAGNVLKGTAGLWEGDFVDGGALTITGNTKTGTVHNFAPSGPVQQFDTVTVSSTRAYSLFWSDPLGGSTNDYDLFILSSAGAVLASSTTTQNGTQDPFEATTRLATAGDRVVVFKVSTAAVRAIHANTNRGALQVFTNGQIRTHSGTVADAYSIAAAPAVGPFPNPFSGSSTVESFTSDGPRRVFYNSNGTAITPGNVLFSTSGGTLLSKPDLTAADGVSTTLSPTSGLNPFFGTSAAAPHAGAIATLLLSGNPSLSQAQMRTILQTNAVDVETPGTDITSGPGIAQAYQSMAAAMTTPSAGLSLGTVTATEASPSNNNGVLEPGENANVVVQLTNPSATTATSVTATLGPAAPDQGIAAVGNTNAAFGPVSYGNIAPSASASNAGTPFKLTLGSGLTCGAPIPVVLVVNLGGGASPISFNFNLPTGTPSVAVPGVTVTTTLDTTAPPAGAGYTAATGIQNNRLNRNGITSSCSAPKATPALQEAAPGGARHYDSYTITNTNAGAVCYTVSFTTACNTGTTLFSATYNNGGFVPTAIQTNYLADSGVANGLPPYSFIVPAGQNFTVVLHEVAVTANGNGCAYTMNITGVTVPICVTAPVRRISNFDGDTKSDIGIWRPSNGNWYFRSSSNNGFTVTQWGQTGDAAVPGDYDGDGKTDLAVFRPSEGNWYIVNSSGITTQSLIGWGNSTDTAVQGDYDGDGKTDAAVFRPSEGNWYIRKSGGGVRIQNWGTATDKPVPADYDGDGKTDVAVFRPTEGNWYIVRSTGGTIIVNWGTTGDTVAPADYDGDRKADQAIFRPTEGNWYIKKSTGGSTVQGWGNSTDKPVPADYDGDGKADIAVFRQSDSNWYILNSSGGSALLNLNIPTTPADVPVPSAYIP